MWITNISLVIYQIENLSSIMKVHYTIRKNSIDLLNKENIWIWFLMFNIIVYKFSILVLYF